MVPNDDDYPGTPDWIPSEGSNLWSLIDQGVDTPDDTKFIYTDSVNVVNYFGFNDPAFIGTSEAIRFRVRMRSTDLSVYVRCYAYINDIQVTAPVTMANSQVAVWQSFTSDWLPLERTAAQFVNFAARLEGWVASRVDVSELEVEILTPGGIVTTSTTSSSTTTSSTFSTTSSTASFTTSTSTTVTTTTTITTPVPTLYTIEFDCNVEITDRNFRA